MTVLLQACLNGARTKADHPALPVSVDELISDAVACVAAGAGAVHFHPRDASGRESLEPAIVNEVAAAVHDACGVPVCVSTGAWIEPDVARRIALVRAWRAPNLATVNLSEEGATRVMEALVHAGVGIEAGVSVIEDVEVLARSGSLNRVARVLVEPVDVAASEARQVVEEVHSALDDLGFEGPRLQHGDGEATWVLIGDAVRRGIETRVGLEDTSYLPDGELASGNEALVRAARRFGAGA